MEDSKATSSDEGEEENEWMQLMGKDLILKKMGPLSSINSSEEIYAEMGDAIEVEYVGRTLLQSFSSSDDSNLCDYPIINRFIDGSNIDDSDTDSNIFVNVKDALVTLGDGDVIPALEMATRFIPINHYGIIRAHPKFAYGPYGYSPSHSKDSKHVDLNPISKHPPNTSVEFQVRIKSRTSSESSLFSSANFTIQRAHAKKKMGNECFNNEKNQMRALKLYQSSAKLMDSFLEALNDENQTSNIINTHTVTKEEMEREATSIIIDCLNNSSLLHFKNGEYGKAKEMATTVLAEYDRDNTRALCRAAKAAMMDPNGTYEEAKAAIDAAMEMLGENDKDVIRLLTEWKRRKRDHKKKEKEMFSKMMQGGEKCPKKEGKNHSSKKRMLEKKLDSKVKKDNESSAAVKDDQFMIRHKKLLWVAGFSCAVFAILVGFFLE